MSAIRQLDLSFGLKKEQKLLPILNKHFKGSFKHLKGYSKFDFQDDTNKIYIELKSRRIHKTQYDTTMIGYNKVEYGFKQIEKGYRVIFVWCYTDKICYYELTTESFSIKWVNRNVTTRQDRGQKEISDVALIPVNILVDI